MPKVTKEEIKQMEKLQKEGNSILKIAKLMKRPYVTVRYYLDEEFRQKRIQNAKEYTKRNPVKRTDKLREYQRKYHNNRYKNDPEYRRKQIERNKK